MNVAAGGEEKKLVERYLFNGWALDINSRALVSPAGDMFKLPVPNSVPCCTSAKPGPDQTRAELLKKMTGRELKPHDRTVDVTIRRIRKHFRERGRHPEIIATIHGEGYRFCGELEQE